MIVIHPIYNNGVDLLADNEFKVLSVKNSLGEIKVSFQPPESGWTHEALVEIESSLGYFWNVYQDIYDLYLGEVCIGGSEV